MMLYLLLVVSIFLMEIALSFLLNHTSIAILTRKTGLTIRQSLLAGILYWARLYLVARVSDWDTGLMAASVLGDTVGDILVAKRKQKPKKKTTRQKFGLERWFFKRK
jgi:hypothetical protein